MRIDERVVNLIIFGPEENTQTETTQIWEEKKICIVSSKKENPNN